MYFVVRVTRMILHLAQFCVDLMHWLIPLSSSARANMKKIGGKEQQTSTRMFTRQVLDGANVT